MTDWAKELDLLALRDFEARAGAVLPGRVFSFASDRSDGTSQRARTLLDSLGLLPRYLCDVGTVSTSTTVLGEPLAFPVLVAPSIPQTFFNPRGETATAAATATAGVLAVAGMASQISLRDFVESARGRAWCEVLLLKDRGLLRAYLERAEEAGCKAICWTVDRPIVEAEVLESLRDPDPGIFGSWHWPALQTGAKITGRPGDMIDSGAGFNDLEWLVSSTSLPVVVRGLNRGDDARRCVGLGAQAIVVANHWAKLLDSVVPAIEALPEILDAVGGDCEVLVEGGLRRGVDILKALALGARATLVGRPVWWGLAVAGEEGVARVLEILRIELEYAMTMCGATTVDELDRSLLAYVPTRFDAAASPPEWYGAIHGLAGASFAAKSCSKAPDRT